MLHITCAGRTSIPKHSLAVNQELLSSLGDPEKQQSKAADSNKREWLALVPNWLSKTSIARSALESIAGEDSSAAADTWADTSRSTRTTAAQRPTTEQAAAADSSGDAPHDASNSLSSRAAAERDSMASAGKSSLLSSQTLAGSQALPDVDSLSSRPAAWKSTLKHYYRSVGFEVLLATNYCHGGLLHLQSTRISDCCSNSLFTC